MTAPRKWLESPRPLRQDGRSPPGTQMLSRAEGGQAASTQRAAEAAGDDPDQEQDYPAMMTILTFGYLKKKQTIITSMP